MSRNTSRNKTTIHPKWYVLLVAGLIAYSLAQPLANRKFGWKLPSLASLLGGQPEHRKSNTPDLAADNVAGPAEENSSDKTRTRTGKSETPPKSSLPTRNNQVTDVASNNPPATADGQLLHGMLRETRRDEYVSPAGLRYTRGSEEGHRLHHIARHLEDVPDRPGRHGVFEGDMRQVLLWLDEAYERAKSGAKGTKIREEDGMTVNEVTFDKPLGYIGGRDGGRSGNPSSKRLRLVLDGDRVITAFPF